MQWKSSLMLLLISANAAQGAEIASIGLSGYQNELVIDQNDENFTVKVAIKSSGTEYLSIGVGNAAVDLDSFDLVRFCPGCNPAYFIPAYDRSSTYGAVTGIIAWSSGTWWSLSVLPLTSPGIDDPDGDGVFDLIDYLPDGRTIEYHFNEGLLRKVE